VDLTYEMRRALRHDVGPLAAAVFDVLAHYDVGDDGVEIAAGELASESGVSPKTAQRMTAKLREVGVLKWEEQFRDNRQVVNRYRPQYDRIGSGHPDRPGGQGDQANTSTSNQVELAVTDSHVVLNSRESVVVPGEQTQKNPKAGLRPAMADSPPQEDSHTRTQKPRAIPWVPMNSPMPMPVKRQPSGGRRFIDVLDSAMWLVTYFEGPVLERANREAVAKGRKVLDVIPDSRKQKWIANACELVMDHPLHEVVAVIDWLFGTWCGQLPYCVLAERLEYVKPSELKLTRIVQIQENYDSLVAEMRRGNQPDPSAEMARIQQTKINFGEPFSDPGDEAQVAELVQLFTEFQMACGPHKEVIHHSRTWRWAKSFRIMLAYRGYGFDDLKMVVSTLRDCPDMDRTRYNDAYDLDRGGEWEHVQSAARLARLKSERKLQLLPRGRQIRVDDGDEFGEQLLEDIGVPEDLGRQIRR
jgi:hypothetical protein